MQKLLLGIAPALLMASGLLATPAYATGEQPFITAKFYKKNISLEQFRENTRSYFRSEAAFDLIVDYTADEIGQKLSDSEFIALMRSDQVRTRECIGSITTGSLLGNQFNWFTRECRYGELIVQAKVGDRWIDLFSLNCLNAVEDQTPVPFIAAMPVMQPQVVKTVYAQQPQTYVVTTPGMVIGGTVVTVGCVCCGRGSVIGTPTVYMPGQVSVTTNFGF
jgi:hypothetical protein